MQFANNEQREIARALAMYAGCVGARLETDYGVKFALLAASHRADWLWGMVRDCWVDDITISNCAFRIANEWQQHDLKGEGT